MRLTLDNRLVVLPFHYGRSRNFCTPVEVFLCYLFKSVTVAYHFFITHEGGVQLSAFPKSTTSRLASFVFILILYAHG